VLAVVMLLDSDAEKVRLAAWGSLPARLKEALTELPVGVSVGGCAAAASLGRQVVVRSVAEDELADDLRAALLEQGINASCSTPIVTAGDRIHGTLAVYFETARGPTTEELDLISRLAQLAGIAIRRREDQAALSESEARFRALFDNVVDGVYQGTPDGELVSANPALVSMLGFPSVDELSAHGGLAALFADPRDRDRLLAELATCGRVRNFEYRLRRRDGSVITALENSRVVYDEHGRALYHEGTITDITERKAAERALFNEKERAQVTLKSIGDAVVTTDADGRIDYLNPVAEQLSGWERRQAQGQPIETVISLRDEESDEPAEVPVHRCLREGRVVGLADNIVLVGRDGTRVAIQDSAAPILDRNGRVIGAVMVFHDVSRERQLHRKLAYHASHDSLTGLINRREFEERLSSALRELREDSAKRYALLYIDLDQFKVVNDTCGHAAGDLLLRQLGDLLQAQVPPEDVIGRLGGDEFAVLLGDCTAERAVQVAEGLRETIARFRFSWRDGAMQVGASIGVVTVEPPIDSIGSLMSAADVACYVAKDLGRNRIHVYEEGDAAERHQEMQWVGRINRAREEERFELFYQPIVPIGATREPCPQFELLLRMRDERGELVPTTTFIPAAERYNLMPSLDRWVITQVLEDLVYRENSGRQPYMLALNLSGTTLNDARFIDFLLDELSAAAVPPGALCFEITETAAIANLAQVVRFMRSLKEHGVKFSLDDFGTGLSSLTYLKNLPVDYVKIDGQFIRNVTRDTADQSMVEAIAQMARALKVQTIAERVESRAVLRRLGEIGISFAQGYYVAVPQPVSELPIRARARVPAHSLSLPRSA
jgi:diguanylate cyclase (GGDEF)-like protein/PAS domain S-box-containing protein